MSPVEWSGNSTDPEEEPTTIERHPIELVLETMRFQNRALKHQNTINAAHAGHGRDIEFLRARLTSIERTLGGLGCGFVVLVAGVILAVIYAL